MFYIDNKILNMENNKEYVQIVKYLENLFLNDNNVDIIVSIVGYSWYLFVEGPCLFPEISNKDLEYLKTAWLKYHDMALTHYKDNDELYFILGYTFYLHGFYIKNITNNEQIGLGLISKSNSITKNDELKSIIEIFIKRSKNKKTNKIDYSSSIFKTNSLLDMYFREMFYIIK